MNKQEIEQAAEEYSISHADSYLSAGYHWSKAANFVNSRQPYTVEDMRVFYVWCIRNGWHPYDDDGDFTEWLNVKTNKLKSFDELIKLWEESK